MTTINIDTIAYGGDPQVRAAIDEQVVIDYAAQMAAGTVFPPIVVFAIDGTGGYDLADGGHRIRAARRTGATSINAEVREGTALDALWYGLGANRTHGHRFTRGDMKHAVQIALRMWPEKSQNLIAQQVGCTQGYVSRLKGITSNTMPTRVTGQDGKSYPARRPVPQDSPTPDDNRARSTTTYRVRKLDPTQVIENTTHRADAEAGVFESDIFQIDFGSVDREQLRTCIGALKNERHALGAVIRKLESFVG